jgi:hypothetical protein
MSLVESPRALRERLRNPANAVPDLGIDLKRKPTLAPAPAAPVPAAPTPAAAHSDDPRILWIKRRKPDETEAAFIERQITHHRGRLEVALARREKLFGKRHSPRIEDIQDAVCAVYRVETKEMLSKRRSAHLVRPRHVAMYLAKEMTGLSLPGIGRKFAFRDHTTVLHAVRKITGERANDPELDAMISRVEALFASPTNPEDATCNCPPTTAQ